MAELSQETAPESVRVMVGPGARLKAGREAQQQSLEQAARHLRLDEPTLAAIEADQYPAHVPATFLRGYLRAYAKWLELPADEIVAAYNEKQPDEAQLAGLKSLLALPQSESSRSSKWLWTTLSVFVLGAVIVAAVMLTPSDWLSRLRSSQPSTVNTDATESEPISAAATSGELALQLAPEEPLPISDAPVEPVDVAAESVTATTANVPPVAPPTTAVPNSSTTVTTSNKPAVTPTVASTTDSAALSGGNESLEFAFIEDCWIRVTDASGVVLSVGIKQKGQRIRLSGVAPLTVVLGNPPGVQLKHNARAVDLSSYPASRPATITLQQQRNN